MAVLQRLNRPALWFILPRPRRVLSIRERDIAVVSVIARACTSTASLRKILMRDVEVLEILLQRADWKKRLAKEKRALRRIKEENAYAKAAANYLKMLSSEKRVKELISLVDEVGSDCFWKVFIAVWSMCDSTWSHTPTLCALLEKNGQAPLDLYDEDHRRFFDNLPTTLTVYRGCDRSRVHGLSWSTDREVAVHFAWGHRGIKASDPVIVTAEFDKSCIFAVCIDRHESEVIGVPSKILAVESLR